MTADRSAFTNGMSTDQTPAIDELLESCGRIRARKLVHDSRTYFACLSVVCPDCGRAVVFDENRQTMVMCQHTFERLNRECERTVDRLPEKPFDTIMGYGIEVTYDR